MAVDEDAYRSPIIGSLRLPADPSGSVDPDAPVDVIIEVNGRYPGGATAAVQALVALWTASGFTGLQHNLAPDADLPPALRRITAVCYQTTLSRSEVYELVRLDRERARGGPTVIFKMWPDYEMDALIDRSAPTVKADAAWRSYAATGRGIVWAVIDSGIQGDHAHFSNLQLATEGKPRSSPGATRGLHRDFSPLVQPSVDPAFVPTGALVDELGHGTHVAGIIAGRCPDARAPKVASSDEPPEGEGFVARTKTGTLCGMAPDCELVSLKVFRLVNGAWKTSSAAVMAALNYLRSEVNVAGVPPRVHGVNLSLGCDWDPNHYAAGQSPLCQLINRVVDTGIVVVVSAGNSGKAQAQDNPNASVIVLGSITEPAHADGCITVGSTHRDAPHTFGISWTSSKGPTMDGRRKPDVVAPGEWITSASAGLLRSKSGQGATRSKLTYAEQSGTSMAAPHVSGVVAGYLSARPEFIGKPRRVKELLCQTAVDLGRERHAQGAGLVDAMAMLSDR